MARQLPAGATFAKSGERLTRYWMVVQGSSNTQFSKVCPSRFPLLGFPNDAISRCQKDPLPRHPLSTSPLFLLLQALDANTTQLKMTQAVAATFPALSSPTQPPPKLVITKGKSYKFWIFALDSEGQASAGVQV